MSVSITSTLTVACDCWALQRLAVDVLTTVCCLSQSACGRRLRERLLADSRSSLGIGDKSLICSVSGATNRLRPLLPPPAERRVRRRSFSNNDLLLSEKLGPVLNDRAGVVLPSPLGPAGVDRTAENATDGANVVTRRRFITGRGDDADNNDEEDRGIDRKPNDATEIDRNSSRRGSETNDVDFTSIHAMLVVVTADMVAATAQIGESDRGSGIVESTNNDDA